MCRWVFHYTANNYLVCHTNNSIINKAYFHQTASDYRLYVYLVLEESLSGFESTQLLVELVVAQASCQPVRGSEVVGEVVKDLV